MAVSTGYCEGCKKRLSACVCVRAERAARRPRRPDARIPRTPYGLPVITPPVDDKNLFPIPKKIVGDDYQYATVDPQGRLRVVKTHRIEINEFTRDAIIGIVLGLCVMALLGVF